MSVGIRSAREPGRDAVVFSSYVPTQMALSAALEFLRVFETRFADCDVFVGINPGSLPEWEAALHASSLPSVRIAYVDPLLAVDSDASGFQTALRLMRDQASDYRLVWFGHTKGATTGNAASRRHMIRNLYLKRDRIERLFHDPRIGSFAHEVSVSLDLAEIDARMDAKVFEFPFRGIGTFYLHTFYVLRGSIVKRFLDGCTQGFFTSNLLTDLGFDRYFFERDFSRLADRFGYYPAYRVRQQHMSTVPVTRRTLRGLYAAWESQLPADARTTLRFR